MTALMRIDPWKQESVTIIVNTNEKLGIIMGVTGLDTRSGTEFKSLDLVHNFHINQRIRALVGSTILTNMRWKDGGREKDWRQLLTEARQQPSS